MQRSTLGSKPTSRSRRRSYACARTTSTTSSRNAALSVTSSGTPPRSPTSQRAGTRKRNDSQPLPTTARRARATSARLPKLSLARSNSIEAARCCLRVCRERYRFANFAKSRAASDRDPIRSSAASSAAVRVDRTIPTSCTYPHPRGPRRPARTHVPRLSRSNRARKLFRTTKVVPQRSLRQRSRAARRRTLTCHRGERPQSRCRVILQASRVMML